MNSGEKSGRSDKKGIPCGNVIIKGKASARTGVKTSAGLLESLGRGSSVSQTPKPCPCHEEPTYQREWPILAMEMDQVARLGREVSRYG